MKPRVLVSIPNGDGWVHKCVAQAAMGLLLDQSANCVVIMPTHRPYENNLHHIRLDFLNGPYDFWLNIDADNPPVRNPLELCSLGLDFVGLPTLVWHSDVPGDRPFYVNAMKEVPGGFQPWQDHGLTSGVQEVDAVGSGCFLSGRTVMEAIPAPFMREYDSEGRVICGGDFAFCKRARRLGFSIHAHFDYCCRHFNELNLNEVVSAFGAWQERAAKEGQHG